MNRGQIKAQGDGTYEAIFSSCWGTKKSWTGFYSYAEALRFLRSKNIYKHSVTYYPPEEK